MLTNRSKVTSNLADEKTRVVDVFPVNHPATSLHTNGFLSNKETFGYEYNLAIGSKGLISNRYIFVIFSLDRCNPCNERP